MTEGYRAAAQTETRWTAQSRLDFHLHSGGLESGMDATTGSDSVCGLIEFSVFAVRENGSQSTQINPSSSPKHPNWAHSPDHIYTKRRFSAVC